MNKVILKQKTLKELIHYAPNTGIFTWLVRDRRWFPSGRSHKWWNSLFSGITAGSIGTNGYRRVKFLGRLYLSHRLAFLYMTGAFPLDEVDHENHIKDDNRWLNLVAATHPENSRNQSLHKNNNSGYTGVHWSKDSNKWLSKIRINGKDTHLGSFDELEDAAEARKEAEVKYGFHENHGRDL